MAFTNGNGVTQIPPMVDERTAAQKFMDDYDILVTENKTVANDNASLRVENASLLSEVQMLREELARIDHDRTRLQGFAANLSTRLAVIQDTISVAIREAALHKVEAAVAEIPEKSGTATLRDLLSAQTNARASHLPSTPLPDNSL
jgi:hypothetical protein